MAIEFGTSSPHDTAAGTWRPVDAVRSWFPWRAVVLPWLAARVIVLIAVAIPDEPSNLRLGRITLFDGSYFMAIATRGYDVPYVPGTWTVFPFFPLYPAIVGVVVDLGAPLAWSAVATSWLFALVAGAGAHRLAVRHLPSRAAPWATWFLAIAPGAITLTMAYSDSLYLASAVWAMVLVDERRWWAAGIVAAAATASRPNGWIAVVALVIAALVARAGWRALAAVIVPSAAFVVGWAWYLWTVTGDALVFYNAKSAWDEVTIGALVSDPLAGDHAAAVFHLSFAIALAVPWCLRVRHQPAHWTAFVVLGVVPPLVLGIEGTARYAVLAFPMPFAVADLLTATGRRWPPAVALVLSAGGMFVLGVMMFAKTWLP